MIGPMTAVTAVSAAAKLGGVLAVLGHHLLHHLAGAGGVGDRRAGHAGEDDALHDVDLREPAAEAADQRVAEAQQPSVMMPVFMISAARMKSGTASRM